MRAPSRRLWLLLVLVVAVTQGGCIWTHRGQPYPTMPSWPPQGTNSEKTLGIVVRAEQTSNAKPLEDHRDLLFSAQNAAYQVFKESGRFTAVRLNEREGVDYVAQVKVVERQTDNLGWWTVASLFLIPASGEIQDEVTLELFTAKGEPVGRQMQTVVHGGKVHLFLAIAFPFEMLGGTYTADRVLGDALRAMVAEAIRTETF